MGGSKYQRAQAFRRPALAIEQMIYVSNNSIITKWANDIEHLKGYKIYGR